jgi:hypothetical protein
MFIAIERISDGQIQIVEQVSPSTFVSQLKKKSRKYLEYQKGCRLVYRGKILKSRRTLNHYGIYQGAIIFMYDVQQLPDSLRDEDSSPDE